MHIVIFNLGYCDPQILTNSHGFVEEFSNTDFAAEAAESWLDGKQYRSYTICKQQSKK